MQSTTTAVDRGRAAEDLALAFLSANGLALLARNYRCRGGEVDLVMRDGDAVVFVEVRRRRRAADAAASITAAKRKRLARAARVFIRDELGAAAEEFPLRFDAALVDEDDNLRWLRDAAALGGE